MIILDIFKFLLLNGRIFDLWEFEVVFKVLDDVGYELVFPNFYVLLIKDVLKIFFFKIFC